MHHLLIESQGPWAGPNAERFLRDAAVLAESGNRVSVFLVQDGVFSAVAGTSGELPRLAAAGAEVYVDRFAVEQRALTATRLSPHARHADLDVMAAALMADGCKAVWH